MTVVVPDLQDLRSSLTGEVLTEGDPGYDEARKVWNAATDRRPAAVVRCASTEDVVESLRFARRQDLDIAVRGGAHSTAGASMLDDGLVIDLSRMNSVVVDPDARRALVGGGALLADVDAATQEHGLAVPAGLVSHTGVGGLTLGGGMGWLTRKYGLSIDNLISAEVVLADGRVVRTSADQEPDLFWAIRGAGAGFGIVTEFEFQLQPVGPMAHLGLYFWSLEDGERMFARVQEMYDEGLSTDVNLLCGALNAPPAPFVPEEHHFKPGCVAVLVGLGDPETHADAAARLTSDFAPLFEMVSPIPYVALQQLLDEANHWGLYAWEKGLCIDRLTAESTRVLVTEAAKKQSPLSSVLLYRLDGAYAAVPDDTSAFAGTRVPQYSVFVIGVANDASALATERDWVRATWSALQPFSLGQGGYVNGQSEIDDARARGLYGHKYERLAALKAEYDPDNVFNRGVPITSIPASGLG
jgi:FAD/FMN-containing dehydrogenase